MVWMCAGILVLLAARMVVLELVGGSGKETGLPILIFIPILWLATRQLEIVKHIRRLSEEKPIDRGSRHEGAA